MHRCLACAYGLTRRNGPHGPKWEILSCILRYVHLHSHQLRRWADLVLIAPCSADTLAKICHGLCDNVLVRSQSLTQDIVFACSLAEYADMAFSCDEYPHVLASIHCTAARASANTAGVPSVWPHQQTLSLWRSWYVVDKSLTLVGTGAMCEWKDIVAMVVDHFGLQL